MPSTNKTSYLNLNQWEAEDRPMRNDFNSDNLTVDRILGAHVANTDIHITAEERTYLKDSQLTMMYTGTGESTKTIALSSEVRFVIVFAAGKPLAELNSSGKTKTYFALGYAALGASLGLSISATADSITVSQGEDTSGNFPSLNESGVQYKVVMFK